MKTGITSSPTRGGSGAVATELGLGLIQVHCALPHATSAWIAEEMPGKERVLRAGSAGALLQHGTRVP